jgi:hypothetical protein
VTVARAGIIAIATRGGLGLSETSASEALGVPAERRGNDPRGGEIFPGCFPCLGHERWVAVAVEDLMQPDELARLSDFYRLTNPANQSAGGQGGAAARG